MHVVVTGSNGFVGTALCQRLQEKGISHSALVRQKGEQMPVTSQTIAVKDYYNAAALQTVLPRNSTTLIHLAARVHQPKDHDASLYVRENVELTQAVLRAAHAAGIKHIIFVSTIKVYGEFRDEDFTVESTCEPLTPYGKTKLEAEQFAREFCKVNGMNLDIVRIPLVLGSSAKGNLGMVAKLLKWGFPLPFAGIQNRRSILYLNTLVEKLIELAQANATKQPSGDVWVHAVAEPESVSTAQLLSLYASQRQFKIRFFKLPLFVLRFCCSVLDFFQAGRGTQNRGVRSADKLLGSAVLIPGSKKE